MSKGKISPDHPDLVGRNYRGFAQKVGFDHSMNLRSCYTGEMPYTNYTHDFTGIIDYIFYSADTLTSTGVLGPVDAGVMETFYGCPNPHFASDHFSLTAQLALLT